MVYIKVNNYFFIAFLLIIAYISFLIVQPFIIAIIGSFIVAFIFYPIYKKVFKKTKKDNLSAFVVSLLIVIIITIPTMIMANIITKEVSSVYSDITIKLTEDKDLTGIECKKDTVMCKAIGALNNNPQVRFYFSGAVTNLVSSITRKTSTFLFSIPKKIVDMVIMFLLVFFLFKSGRTIWEKINELLPLKESHKGKLLKKFSDTMNGVVYGYLIIAFVEAIIAWIAFTLVGSKVALVLGMIIGLMALIPMIGASVIWVPAAVIYFFSGTPVKAVIIIIAGLIIMFVDIWTRAQVISRWADIHPVIIALGVLGGLLTFGAIGIVIGPLTLSLLVTSIEIYQEEKDSLLI